MELIKPLHKPYNVPFISDEFNGMSYRLIGESGLRASSVGLGTWKMGYPDTGDGSRIDEKTSLEVLDKALESGVVFWDTANRYNNASGNSERIIGTWFKNNPDQRRNIVLATKIFGGMDGFTPNHSRLSRGNILDSVYACLKRLQVDYIDLLYFHAFDPDTPVEESLTAIDDLIRRDLVRYFGVSNFTLEQLAQYKNLENGFSPRCRVIAVQNRYDIVNGEIQQYKGMLEHSTEAKVSFIAYSPLSKGLLTGRYINLANVGTGDRLYDENELKTVTTDRIVMDKVNKLDFCAREWGIEMSKLVLAYLLSIPGMGPVIPAASTAKQLISNADSGKIKLSGEQKNKIKEIIENVNTHFKKN